MNIDALIQKLLKKIGPGKMRGTAYDTAWAARLIELDDPIGYDALEWLREHQLSDGSWGTYQPYYAHDRLICTLAAITAMARFGNVGDRHRLRRARLGMDTAIKALPADTVGETIGFEMLAPTLLTEARKLGIVRRDSDNLLSWTQTIYYAGSTYETDAPTRRRAENILDRLIYHRLVKIQKLPLGKINRFVTVALSAEMAGEDGIDLFDIDRLQEPNGSVGNSPAATVYYALNIRRGDSLALDYLRQVANRNSENFGGGLPDVAPFDIFEPAWVLWNLSLAGELDNELHELCKPHLDFITNNWITGVGVGWASNYPPKDGDDTGLAFDVLTRYGYETDLSAIMHYEQAEYFRCYDLESNPSISANIHMLGALRSEGFESDHIVVEKIIQFLRRTQFLGIFWFDKWHVSPYYPTTHAIIAAAGYIENLVENSVEWVLETQNADGSWGYYVSTAEESAYCLQALLMWKKYGGKVPDRVITDGLRWLEDHIDPPYQSLWIGKCLYSPEFVVRSAILGALRLAATIL